MVSRLWVVALGAALLSPFSGSRASAQWADDDKPPPAPVDGEDRDVEPAPSAPSADADPSDGGKSKKKCFPACRPGYACSPDGRCVSACNPPCGPGSVCTAAGQCRSACDPPCDHGEVCSRDGQCVSSARSPGHGGPAPAPVPPAGPPAPGASPATPPVHQGWGRGAGIWGLVNIPILLGGATAIFLADDDLAGASIGGALTLYAGVTTPIIGAGASSPSGPGVRSATYLLVPGWIMYGIGIASSLVVLGVTGVAAFDDTTSVSSKAAYVPAGFLAMSNLLFGLAGFIEGAQARKQTESRKSGVYFGPSLLASPEGNAISGGSVSIGGFF